MTSVGPRPDFYSTASAQPQEKTKKTREFNPEEAMSVTGGFKDVWQTIKELKPGVKIILVAATILASPIWIPILVVGGLAVGTKLGADKLKQVTSDIMAEAAHKREPVDLFEKPETVIFDMLKNQQDLGKERYCFHKVKSQPNIKWGRDKGTITQYEVFMIRGNKLQKIICDMEETKTGTKYFKIVSIDGVLEPESKKTATKLEEFLKDEIKAKPLRNGDLPKPEEDDSSYKITV